MSVRREVTPTHVVDEDDDEVGGATSRIHRRWLRPVAAAEPEDDDGHERRAACCPKDGATPGADAGHDLSRTTTQGQTAANA